MTGEELVLRQTAQKIIARQKFLEDVIAFVKYIVEKRGVVTDRDVCRFHTRERAILKDFFGFNFSTDGVRSDFGGESLKIWHKSFSEVEPVLSLDWNETSKLRVLRFEKSSAWQKAIRKLMRDKKKTDARFNKEKKRQEDQVKRTAERIAKLQVVEKNIKEDSKRLGFD